MKIFIFCSRRQERLYFHFLQLGHVSFLLNGVNHRFYKIMYNKEINFVNKVCVTTSL